MVAKYFKGRQSHALKDKIFLKILPLPKTFIFATIFTESGCKNHILQAFLPAEHTNYMDIEERERNLACIVGDVHKAVPPYFCTVRS